MSDLSFNLARDGGKFSHHRVNHHGGALGRKMLGSLLRHVLPRIGHAIANKVSGDGRKRRVGRPIKTRGEGKVKTVHVVVHHKKVARGEGTHKRRVGRPRVHKKRTSGSYKLF